MDSSVVIKVKYGDTLRRFNARLTGFPQHLELNMDELRAKVRSLFNLQADANFTLTYTDEDGDEVTLADEEDLHDIIRQLLNPVRITLHFDACKVEASNTQTSENATRSPSQTYPQNINPKIAEVLKSIPEPLCDAISKVSAELASKAASTSPVLAELIENLSKVGQSFLNTPNPHSGTATNDQNEVLAKPEVTSNSSVNEGMHSNGIGCAEPASKSIPTPTAVEAPKKALPTPIPAPFFPVEKGKNANIQSSAINSGVNEGNITRDSGVKSGLYTPDLLKAQLENCFSCPKETIEASKIRGSRGGETSGPFPLRNHPSTAFWQPHVPMTHSSNGSFDNVYGTGSMFHKGVRCDGCGVLPITGPRFKSKVKDDYDLCNICFTRMGKDADYTRIDFPLPHMLMQYARNPYKFNHLRPRVDSQFIMDVNVLDGTSMAPSTPFTKIWRMRNNGTLPWSPGLQLLWIGGDRFSSSDSVEVQIPVEGVDVGRDIDMAVDFIAPELPGRYVSYWRMAEPSGHKFGQRVWVLIQVDASLNDLKCDGSLSLNLNLPPEAAGDLNSILKPEKEMVKQNHKTNVGEANFPINDELLVGSDDVSHSTSTMASSSVSPPVPADNPKSPVTSPIMYPKVDGDILSPSAPPTSYSDTTINVSNVAKESSKSSNVEDEKKEINEVEENLLKELEEMGFKEADLNKEVLRVNKYDLELSVDDLCGVSEWDPMLEELREMGFNDRVMNKKLLEKNNGSIFRVVMDLVSGEQAWTS